MDNSTPNPWPNRVGVFHRRDGKHPWRLLLHTGKPELARKLQVAFAATGPKGDYAATPVDHPPRKPR